jgi:DNA-binding LytR/AlgR family response regulator
MLGQIAIILTKEESECQIDTPINSTLCQTNEEIYYIFYQYILEIETSKRHLKAVWHSGMEFQESRLLPVIRSYIT